MLKNGDKRKQTNFDVNKCIICQEGGSLVSTENGRRKIMDAAKIRNDEVYKQLQSPSFDQDFKYHMDNRCYKNYVHKKTLEQISLKQNEEQERDRSNEPDVNVLEPVCKKTRSSVGKREDPSQETHNHHLKCVICDKIQNNGVRQKHRICEKSRAENLREAAKFLQDDVFTRIADLNTDESIFGADIYYHTDCFSKYLHKFKYSQTPPTPKVKEATGKRSFFNNYVEFIEEVISRGNGITLTEIRDMINMNDKINIQNSEVKIFLQDHFGERIKFCESNRKNESLMVFSSSMDISDMINTFRALHSLKMAGQVIREKLLKLDFGLHDKFCDAEELKHSWKTTKIPDELLAFFSELFNMKKTTFLKEYYSETDENDETEKEDFSLKSMKIGSLFQIMFYNLHNGYKKTPLHVMNSVEIYERCKSKELITSFNRSGLCMSYANMKKHRSDLAKFTISKSSANRIPLPTHFSSSTFTTAAFDNFDHSDKSTLSGKSDSHDTVITLFQEIPETKDKKPSRKEVNLKQVKSLSKLPCQELVPYSTNKTLTVPSTFDVPAELYHSEDKEKENEKKKKISSCVRGNIDTDEINLPSWSGIEALLTKGEVAKMQVAFLPFLPHPVTDIATVYTAMLNFSRLADQLEQQTLPVFCDEGVFRIVLNIYLKCPDKFENIIPMLGGFHMAKCVQRCIGKYIKGTGLEDALVETGVFGIKVMESIIGGTNYVRSLRGVQILCGAIESVKWKAFWKLHDTDEYKQSITAIKEFAKALEMKDNEKCHRLYENLEERTKPLLVEFRIFSDECKTKSEVCEYWDGLIHLTSFIHNLIAADRRGDWEGHLQAVQDLLPVFCEADCINYLRYGSWYLEKVRKLEEEHPAIYNEFLGGKFVVQTSAGAFKAVAPDMKLEQTINRSQKSSSGIIGQTKTASYVSEWELVYHEILAISNCYSDLTKSKTRTGPELHHELAGGISKQLNESVNKVAKFIIERGNPYETLHPPQLHNITSGQLVPKENAKKLLKYFADGKQRYEVFREERMVTKSKKLSETITKVILPKFEQKSEKQKKSPKPALKKIGDAQKQIDIARARGYTTKEIMSFDHLTNNMLFEEDLTSKPNKSELVKQLQKKLDDSDFIFTSESQLKTAVMIDFMSLIRRYPTSHLKTFNDLFRVSTFSILHEQVAEIDIVYDSYLEDSIKECERIRRRSSCEPLQFINLKLSTPLPVQMNRFWASGQNKQGIQEISRHFFKAFSKDSHCRIVLSGYVTDSDGIKPCEELCHGNQQACPELDSLIEEADSRIIPHIQQAILRGACRVIVHSNDTDVLVYLLYYIHHYIGLGLEELWIKYGTGEKARYIPVHKLGFVLGPDLSKIVLKAHILTGCDVTSKIGTKAAALATEPEKYLKWFGETNDLSFESFQSAENYLVQVLKKNSKCTNFNDLRLFMYTTMGKSLADLPPTSTCIRGHLLRCHYAVRESMNLLVDADILDVTQYGWERVGSVLFPEKSLAVMPKEYFSTCGCTGCTRNCGCRTQQISCTEFCKCGENCKNDF